MSKSRPQQSTSKRKARNDAAAEQPTAKRTSTGHSKTSKRVKDPPSLSDEALFKIRHAAEFDGESVREEPEERIQVKQEPKDDDQITISPRRVTRSSTRRLATDTPCRTKACSIAATPAKDFTTTSPRDDADQESIFVAILSQASWDLKMTESAVDNLSRRARQAAANGELFDMEYIESIIKRLDRTGIETGRRSQVVELLREGLRHLLIQWDSRIDQVGSKTKVLSTLSDCRLATKRPSKPIAPLILDSGSSKMLYVDISPAKEEHEQPQRHQSSNDFSNSTSDSNGRDSYDCSESEYLDYKRESPTKNRGGRTPLAQAGSSAVIDYDKISTNVRLYGTRYPKTAFDMLARCVIFAWAAAPHSEDTPTNTREYALLRWRKVSGQQKCAWQKLFEERGDPATDVFKKSLQLLLSQDLLKLFVPGNRLQAALLRCRERQLSPCAQVTVNANLQEQDTPTKASDLQKSEKSGTNVDLVVRTEAAPRREPFSKTLKNFPRMVQATSRTPNGQACLIPSAARRPDPRTCIFILNSPDVRPQLDLTESHVRAACQQAELPGLSYVTRQTHNVFVAFFSSKDQATQARQTARIKFEASPAMEGIASSSLRLKVRPESHSLQVNHMFVLEIDRSSIKHDSVPRRVSEALAGPLARHFHLFRQQLRRNRTRYLLRPRQIGSPIFVERFYIPLDASEGANMVWGIFKPFPKHWLCPSCHGRCHSGAVNSCPNATLLG